MRQIPIKTVFLISALAALIPQLAVATPSFSCSSNLVVSLDDGYQASCDGDFSFTDGVLQNNTSISLTAGGSLDIGTKSSLYAPLIDLYSPIININVGTIFDVTYLNASNINIDAGKGSWGVSDKPSSSNTVLNPGASIDLGGNTQASGTLINTGGTFVIKYPILKIAYSVFNPDNSIYVGVTPVPEPSAYALMVLGLATLGFTRKCNTH